MSGSGRCGTFYYRRTFGISADEFDALLEKQGGGCAICGTCPERVASLHLDHDHVTGRGAGRSRLSCNQGIGKFRDDADLLELAAQYLRTGSAS
ncbi:MAG: endonuclease VII domain-containing protein [Acidimicrobiales bacterium]